jgi:hypothetical protein
MGINTMRNKRRGAALLVVLFIVMAISVLSLGYLNKSTVQLANGESMVTRTQIDCLAESGLEHARGMILNPQDAGAAYWPGANAQQLDANSSDFYDVNVVKINKRTYTVTSEAYRLEGGERISEAAYEAVIYIKPVIALWQNAGAWIGATETINGEVYSKNSFSITGTVNGDVYCDNTVSGTPATGNQKFSNVKNPPVTWPAFSVTDYSSQYYYDGGGPYSVEGLAANVYDGIGSVFPSAGAGNPAKIFYRNGNLRLEGSIDITGMLVVKGDLHVRGSVTIRRYKDHPALLVSGKIIFDADGTILVIKGLVQVDGHVDMQNRTGSQLDVDGALFTNGTNSITGTDNCTAVITANPNKASVRTWSEIDVVHNWTPAAGAVYRSITRN